MNTNAKITCDFGDDRCRIVSARLEKDIFMKTRLHTSPIVVMILTLEHMFNNGNVSTLSYRPWSHNGVL